MKRLLLLLVILFIPVIAFGADAGPGSYLTLTPDDVPDDASQGVLYWDSDNDQLYIHDLGGWFGVGPNHYQFDPVASPTNAADAAETTEGTLYYDSDDDRLYIRTGAGAWEPLNEQTLDEAYDESATITVDNGAVTLNNTEVDAQNTLTIANSGAAGTGQAISITDTKTGAHSTIIIDHTFGNASSIGMTIQDNAADTTNGAALLKLASVDATKTVTGLLFSAATNAMMPTAIDVTDPEISIAIDIGANTFQGTTPTINTDWWDMNANGDVSFTETGGAIGSEDFAVAGFTQLGSTDGGILGNDTDYTAFSSDGVITFAVDARPTHKYWFPVTGLDLDTSDGTGTAPTENEAGGAGDWSTWTFTEATDTFYFPWVIPDECDISGAINVYIVWGSENGGGDTCLWRARHNGGVKFNNDETPATPATALDTPIADDTTDVQHEVAITAAGVINGATFQDFDMVTLDFYLTDCDGGAEADMYGFILECYWDSL